MSFDTQMIFDTHETILIENLSRILFVQQKYQISGVVSSKGHRHIMDLENMIGAVSTILIGS